MHCLRGEAGGSIAAALRINHPPGPPMKLGNILKVVI
jgi:hypothetical protein